MVLEPIKNGRVCNIDESNAKSKSREKSRMKKKSNDFADYRLYILMAIVFFAGMVIGSAYFKIAIQDIKTRNELVEKYNVMQYQNEEIDKDELIKNVLIKNLKVIVIFWILRSFGYWFTISNPYMFI